MLQVEAPVEMLSFSVVLPCAFEGEFAEKTVCLGKLSSNLGLLNVILTF